MEECRKTGTFKIDSIFNVTRRGIIVVGIPIDVIPKLGNSIAININGKEENYKIIGIERGNPNEEHIIKFGLLLHIDDPGKIKYILESRTFLSGFMATIFT
jgi:hypothetical protein